MSNFIIEYRYYVAKQAKFKCNDFFEQQKLEEKGYIGYDLMAISSRMREFKQSIKNLFKQGK